MDPAHFTGCEIIDMAIRIEENGLKFYIDAGKASKTKRLKEIFNYLAEEESRHMKAFMDLRKLIPDEELSKSIDPYSADDSLYLDALADSEAFTDKRETPTRKARGEKSALNLAIAMEKDTILFYNEMLRMVREKDRPILEKLINEEKAHLRKLSEHSKTRQR